MNNETQSPVPPIHPEEEWLYKNPEAMASVQKGLQQSANNEVVEITIDFSEVLEDVENPEEVEELLHQHSVDNKDPQP